MKRSALRMVLLGSCGALAACSSLPNSGPTAGQLLNSERDQAKQLGFEVIDISASTVPAIDLAATPGLSALTSIARSGRNDLIGPGDVLQVNIYEVGVSLFGASGVSVGSGQVAPDPTASAQNINGVIVEQDGSIRLPYIGRIEVAGKTTNDVQRLVVRGLSGKSQAPQAVVSVVRDVTNVVFVSGTAQRPGRVQLSLANEKLLDVVATAGGTVGTDGPQTTIVQVSRDGRTVEAYLQDVQPGSPANITMRAGDRVNLIRRPLTFLVFGATGRVSQVPFDNNSVSLAEALARAGGPDDSRADPSAIFLFRDIRGPGTTSGPSLANEGQVPRIYRLDMTKPSSFFLAQRFAMRDKDLIYVANARINQTRKLVEIVNLLFSPIFLARQVAN